MYLADHHIHSCCSPDSEAPLSEMLRAAQAAGLSDLCATDHCDLLDLDGGRVTGLDWAPILTQYQAARGDCPAGVKLRLGLELGGAPVDPDCAAAIRQGLSTYGIEVGESLFIKYCRVGASDAIGQITGAELVCMLVGERPGLTTAESMSA